MLRTNIEIDEKLVAEGLKLTHLKTKKALVDHALRELVSKKKRKRLLAMAGNVEWAGDLGEMRKTRT